MYTLSIVKSKQNLMPSRCLPTSSSVVNVGAQIGASSAILRAGYNLDCLMLRYAGVDWRDPAFANCNAGCAHSSNILTLLFDSYFM